MANTVISLRSSGATSNTPSLGVLANGELSLNFADGILYYKTAANTLGSIRTTQASGLNKEIQFNDSGSFGSNASLTFDKANTTLTTNNFVANTITTGTGVGGIIAGANVIYSNIFVANSTTTSTSNSTGAIISNGGLGVKGNVYADAVYDGGIEVISFANQAFNLANTANVLAQAAFNFANTANIKVDSAYAFANIANTIAQAAFNFANTANIKVDSAFAFANIANIKVDSAYAFANIANIKVDAAFTKANAANVLAQAAFDKANTDATSITATAGVYGNATYVPVITLTANGRISSITNTAISGGGGSPVTISTFNTTANGTTLSYDLGFNPVSASAIFVTIDGVVQPESTYSVNTTANTITFGAEPTNTENVRVVAFASTNPYILADGSIDPSKLSVSTNNFITATALDASVALAIALG